MIPDHKHAPHAHLAEWKDLLSGLSLLYMGPDGPADDLTDRAIAAISMNQVGNMEHVAALMMAQLLVRGTPAPAFSQERWGRLSRHYHEHYCSCHKDGSLE